MQAGKQTDYTVTPVRAGERREDADLYQRLRQKQLTSLGAGWLFIVPKLVKSMASLSYGWTTLIKKNPKT